MVPVVVLAVIAFAFIRLLMGVVAHDETAGVEPAGFQAATADFTLTQAFDPTIRLRSNTNDAAHAFLLPAVDEPAGADTESGRSAGATDRESQLG
jgi:hypothetical protein